jgi:hypothetical protein
MYISDNTADYIFKNFTKASGPGSGRKWHKVCRKGNDWKYGHFYVSIETKEYRNATFDEFYGGGIVD